ncbi:peptide chain release factor 2 [bacterium BMS3Abin02]|nr:peptide chain release factor 2 [bacterium BMS3Abin02]GBE21035.1 peptide chain release factor 2 [bacterium BMS3Bbin01]
MPGGSFDLDAKAAQLPKLREMAASPDLWSDATRAAEINRTLARYEGLIAHVDRLEGALDDAEVMLELAGEEDDAAAAREAVDGLVAAEQDLQKLETESLYFGVHDEARAIFSVHAGAGGVDAQDWAEMLLRMYLRYLEHKGLNVEIDEITPGDEAGIKSATLTVDGEHAYAILEGERGVHRLVRISPFDAARRRHTSFAGVDVIPEVEEEEIEINQDDLRIETYRSQGAGGQHVNVTDSAVRITHLPTGTVVTCQNERSQLQNRARAMAILKARLAELARQERAKELDEIRGDQEAAAWGRQLRSYVLQPYQMVKDLRTGTEVGNVQGVLDGDLDQFVDAYLHWRREKQEQEAQ